MKRIPTSAPAKIQDSRAPENIAVDGLRSLIADFALNGQAVTMALIGGVLRLTVPVRLQNELAPTWRISLEEKGSPGLGVELLKDTSREISEAVFNQPNGVVRREGRA
jgi:hypothetical protein